MKGRTLAIVVAFCGAVFLASMLRATGGRLAAPVDDSFIYIRYAEQCAAGHPFVYQDGERATSGATSLPWTALLAIGALLGFKGKAALVFAMAIGGACLAFAAKAAGDAERTILTKEGESPAAGVPLATILVLLSGPLQWGAWSGMEIALFAAIFAGAFRAWCGSDGRMTGGVAAWLAILAITRPEGALCAGLAAVLAGTRAARDRDGRSLARAAIPIAAALSVPLLLLAMTGDWRSSGFLSKSLLAAPGADGFGVLRMMLLRAASLAARLLGFASPVADGAGLYAYDGETAVFFLVPGAALFLLIGLAPSFAREARARRAGSGILAIVWIAALCLATAAIEEPDAHFHRYQSPILPIALVFVAVGLERMGRALRGMEGGLALLAPGARLFLIAAGAAQLVFFALAFGDNCEDIDRMQIRLAETIRVATAPDDVIAINDAGALALFSERRTIDLVGLTTPGFAGVWKSGSGALYESLEALPAERRPDWFCFFPNWFELDGIGLWQRKGSVRLLSPSIVDAEKVFARADWSLAGSADRPRFASRDSSGAALAPLRVVDRLDVAYLASERAHDFRWSNREHGGDAGTFVRRAGFVGGTPGDEAIDAGRTIFGEASFDLARSPGGFTIVALRTVSGARERLLVSIDGGEERRLEMYAPGAGLFHEAEVAVIPPGSGRARIRLRLVPEAAESAPLILTHVFALQ